MNRIFVGLILLVATIFSSKGESFTYAALGDSITAGVDVEAIGIDPSYSWATGSNMYPSFAGSMGPDLEQFYNLSLPGARTDHIGYQVELAKWLKPDYVSILIGANDICQWSEEVTFTKLQRYVTELSEVPEIKHIYVGTIPDLEQVYQLGKSSKYCSVFRVMCPGFMLASDQRRAQLSATIAETNNKILQLQVDLPKVYVVDAIGEQKILEGDISRVDCFHPSRVGQQRISDAFARVFTHANR